MLMAAGLDVPQQVFAHGWLLVGGEKMSKSKATGIAPSEIVDNFGSDAFRYYFLRAIAFGQDGSFSWEDMQRRYTPSSPTASATWPPGWPRWSAGTSTARCPTPAQRGPAEQALAGAG